MMTSLVSTFCYVMYDIEDDRIRTEVAEICKDYGLQRVQYSVFGGELTPNHRKELYFKLCEALKKGECRVIILPVCAKDKKAEMVIEVEG